MAATTLSSRREVASIANCLACDSYFVITLFTVPPAREFQGREGTERLLTKLFTFQEALDPARHPLRLLPCPTCAETVHGKPFVEFISDRELEAALTPCRLMCFEEGELPPMYMNAAPPEKKPKWSLTQGVGPQGVELDGSRSGRVYKPSLRQLGITDPMFKAAEGVPADQYKYMMQLLATYVTHAPQESQATIAETWTPLRPLFLNWDAIAADVESDATAAELSQMEF